MSFRILLNGACGRMGSAIIQLANRDYKSINVIPVDIIEKEGIFKLNDVRDFDCIVDFSSREGFISSINYAIKFSKPFVSGTTGLSDIEKDIMNEASKKIAVFYSPNMSIGVNLCFYIVDFISKRIKADVYITDIHHKLKKDKPSGTALRFKEIIENNGLLCDISSSRVGDVVGEHEVGFIMNGERVVISHIANTREIFARGALEAALWINDKGKGFYNFKDMFSY